MEVEDLDPSLFLDLPWLVIREILAYVPINYVYEAFLKVPALRGRLIEEYYSELHFILTPLRRPHLCNKSKSELIDIVSYGEISSFLDDNPDIIPKSARIMTSMDFISMRSILAEYRDRFFKIPRLHFQIESHHFTDDCFEFIHTFPNLKVLQLTAPNFDDISSLADAFGKLHNIESIILLGHGITDWTGIELPHSTKHLDISWTSKCDVTTIKIPPKVEEIYWNDAGLNSKILRSLQLPALLTTLVITECKIETLNLSILPQSLKCFELSSARLNEIQWEDKDMPWPLELDTLILSRNRIDNASLKQVSQSKLPHGLRILKLDGNHFTHLHHLQQLPETLRLLNISKNPLQSLTDPTNSDGSPYYRFPDSLEVLDISECTSRGMHRVERSLISPSDRISLPKSLLELDLSGNFNYHLGQFVFPKSLRKLSLISSGITDLGKYEYSTENGLLVGEKAVAWSDLENLGVLDLSANSILSLSGWGPPPNLVSLDLSSNRIEELSSNSPLFNKRTTSLLKQLQHINLSNNRISSIGEDVHLPPNLLTLNMERNYLPRFAFTDGILNSKTLQSLNLGGNEIEELVVSTAKKSSLKELDLSLAGRDRPLRLISPDALYEAFDRLGLNVSRRKRKTRTLHQFT